MVSVTLSSGTWFAARMPFICWSALGWIPMVFPSRSLTLVDAGVRQHEQAAGVLLEGSREALVGHALADAEDHVARLRDDPERGTRRWPPTDEGLSMPPPR
jgi:hypothetical protein